MTPTPLDDTPTIERHLIRTASLTRTPVTGSIELLPLCNMNCDMCYVRLSPHEMEQKGRLRTADEWLLLGRQMRDAGVLFLLLTGGEPLLYPDFRQVYTGLKEMGMILTINTNGTLLDEDWADFFAQNKPRRINITLYGSDEAAYASLCHYPGGFEKTIKAIGLLRHRGVDVKVGGSLTKANGDDVEKLVALGEELDVPVRIDTYMMPATREREKPYDMQSRLDPESAAAARIKALRLEMGDAMFLSYAQTMIAQIDGFQGGEAVPGPMTCLAGSCSFTVNWQGELRPCVILTQPAASVFDMGFEKAWKTVSQGVQTIRLNAKCSACALRPLCRTCAACALLETGKHDGVPQYMCRYAEESLRLLRGQLEEMTASVDTEEASPKGKEGSHG